MVLAITGGYQNPIEPRVLIYGGHVWVMAQELAAADNYSLSRLQRAAEKVWRRGRLPINRSPACNHAQ
jgi:hypothetical protein